MTKKSKKINRFIWASMGRTLTRLVRIAFQIIATLSFLGFLLLAVGGIVIKTTSSIVQSAMKITVQGYEGDPENVRQFAAFVLEIADTMAIYCIVVGVVLAVFSLIGLIASCRGWYKMLKIYAIILGVLLAVQIIAVAVIFSNPTKFANDIVGSIEGLLKLYGNQGNEGNEATGIWNVIMGTNPYCCGMDGYKDFGNMGNNLPSPCCNLTNGSCDAAAAQSANVKGCRSKVELLSTLKSAVLLQISIVMIIMQAVLVALVVALIFATKGEETIED
ncbi:Tetraspanin-6 [Taenia crassiceps]|uniref:Tetraspanin-6 n=1 Tax=Taenia crassiceps TaxID=6207 RepID=A0ABR4Q3A1_9CEST